MSDVILDASAIIAFIKPEPGHEHVAPVIVGARVPALIIAEVCSWLTQRGVTLAAIEEGFGYFAFRVETFDATRAISTGALIARTRHRGLSLADRACLALAMELRLPVVTADRAWADLDLGIDIRLIR